MAFCSNYYLRKLFYLKFTSNPRPLCGLVMWYTDVIWAYTSGASDLAIGQPRMLLRR